jgi:hypothetical protein
MSVSQYEQLQQAAALRREAVTRRSRRCAPRDSSPASLGQCSALHSAAWGRAPATPAPMFESIAEGRMSEGQFPVKGSDPLTACPRSTAPESAPCSCPYDIGAGRTYTAVRGAERPWRTLLPRPRRTQRPLPPPRAKFPPTPRLEEQ